jgi:hypothetical protein
MSGAPETAHNQNTNPERYEPREIVIEQLPPQVRRWDKGQGYQFHPRMSSARQPAGFSAEDVAQNYPRQLW